MPDCGISLYPQIKMIKKIINFLLIFSIRE